MTHFAYFLGFLFLGWCAFFMSLGFMVWRAQIQLQREPNVKVGEFWQIGALFAIASATCFIAK